MSLIFDQEVIIDENFKSGFNAVFLTQESYIELLDLADEYFHIGLREENCRLPCLTQSYMVISNQKDRLKYALNKNVSLKIKSLFYNNKLEIVVALVYLKKNFTDNEFPHIIISKPEKINETYINKLLRNDTELKEFSKYNNVVPLDEFYTIHGKVGILINYNLDNCTSRSTNMVDSAGRYIHVSNEQVSRPEVTLSVDNCLPPESEIDKVKVKDKGDASSATEDQQELYMGLLVHSGRRGGKFIIKDNKKKYISDAEILSSKNKKDEVVYNVNLLAPSTRAPVWIKN